MSVRNHSYFLKELYEFLALVIQIASERQKHTKNIEKPIDSRDVAAIQTRIVCVAGVGHPYCCHISGIYWFFNVFARFLSSDFEESVEFLKKSSEFRMKSIEFR